MNQEQKQVKRDKVSEIHELIKQVLPILQTMQTPFMEQKKFAENIGLSVGVVGGWVDQGYIPTVKIGKYRMVNMVAITAGLITDLVTDINLDDLIVVNDEVIS